MKLFKNFLLRIPYVAVMVLPYVFAAIFYIWFQSEIKGDVWDEFMGIIVAFSLIGALVVNARIIISSTVMSFRESSIWNLITKLAYAPAHIYLLWMGDLDVNYYMGIFALYWMVIFVISFDLMSLTAAANIAACAKGHDEGKLKLGTAVIMMILSFVYVADIVCAVVQVKKSWK